MRHFQILDKHPPRPWRRKKRYTLGELRWMAKRNGWKFEHHRDEVKILLPDGRPVVRLGQDPEVAVTPPANDRLRSFASLRL